MCVNYDGPLSEIHTPEQIAEDIRIDIQVRKNLISNKQKSIDALQKEINELEQKLADILSEDERLIKAQVTFDDILGGKEE